MSNSYEALHLDQQLCFPLYAATNLIQQLYHPLLKPLGLTYSQYLVMMVLWQMSEDHTEISISDIRRRLKLDIGTLSPLLKRMEKAGHLSRKRSMKDERRVIVELTPQGQALRKEAATVPARIRAQLGSDNEELMTLKLKLNDLVKALSVATEHV